MIWLIVLAYFIAGLLILWIARTSSVRPARGGPTLEPFAILVDSKWHRDLRLPENAMTSKILFWQDACIDTTYFVLSTLGKYSKLDSSSRLFESLVRDQRSSIANFVSANFDQTTGGFRHTRDYIPTTYATICAINIAKRLLGLDLHTGQIAEDDFNNFLGVRCVDKVIRFTWQCFDPAVGGFGPFPGGVPTSIHTDVAVGILRGLRQEIPNDVSSEIKKFLLDKCFKRLPNDEAVGGISVTPEVEQPSSSATRYGLRAVVRTSNTYESTTSEVVGLKTVVPEERRIAMARFWNACQNNGGFTMVPPQPPDLHHTDMSLCGIRMLPLTASELENLVHPEPTMRFIAQYERRIRLHDGQRGLGFAFRPRAEANVYCTRAGVSILTVLAELGSEVAKSRLREMQSLIEGFLESCYVPSLGGFAGYTVRK